MVQPAVVPGNHACHAKVRIAGYKVANFSTEAQQWESSLEVQPAAVLDCAFVLRQACGVQGIARPPAAYAYPRRDWGNGQQLEPQSRCDKYCGKMIHYGSRRAGQREFL